MKISDRNLTNTSPTGSDRIEETQKTERQRNASGLLGSPGGDRVEFSAALDQLARAISAYGTDRSSRVQSLAALYRSGGYQPDSAATSRTLVTEALGAAGH